MTYKIVGVDEESIFPPRVENRLTNLFASKQVVDDLEVSTVKTSELDEEVSGHVDNGKTATSVDNRITRMVSSVNVKNFGAIGDGQANDLSSIQAALDSIESAGTVIIPAGKYGISGGTLRVKAGTTLIGYGAELHRLAGTTIGTMLMNWEEGDVTTGGYEGQSNITVEGIKFFAHGGSITNRPANIATFGHAKNIRVIACEFYDTSVYHALEFQGINGGRIEDCGFYGYAASAGVGAESEAVQIDTSNPGDFGLADGTMSNNVIVTNCYFGPSDALPANPVGIGSHNEGDGSGYNNINVSECIFEGQTIRAVEARDWRDSTISNNRMMLGSANCQGVRGMRSRRLHIIDNTIHGIGPGHAVPGINSSDNAFECMIQGNYIFGAGEGINLGPGSDRASVVGNVTMRTAGPGIVLNSVDHALISGNNFNEVGYGGATSGGIRLTNSGGSSPNDNSVVGNRVRLVPGTTIGVSIVAGTSNNWVFGNDFRGATTAISGDANTGSNRT